MLITTFRKFIKLLRDKNIYPMNAVFLIANNNGQVFEMENEGEISKYLSKDQVGKLNININELAKNPDISEEYLSYFLPITNEADEPICIICLLVDKENINNDYKSRLTYFEIIFKEMLQQEVLFREKDHSEFLYALTTNLYSAYDINELLFEALRYISHFYPDDKFEFWFSQDYRLSSGFVKIMSKIPNTNDIKDKAFIQGSIIINPENNELAIPIKGRQGTYGVIYLKSEKSIDSFLKTNYLDDIVEIIGSKFENFQLNEQSANLIKRLELINSLTKMINNNPYKDEVINGVIEGLSKIYKNQTIMFIEVDKEKMNFINMKSNIELKDDIIPVDGTYLGLSYKRGEAIIIADSKVDYGIEGKYCDSYGYRSLIIAPIFSEAEVIGVLTVCSEEANYYTYDDFKFLQLLSQQFNLSLTNSNVLSKIQQLAITDYLTGLFNRSYLDDKIKESQLADNGGILLLFDLDDFKDINDTYGHDVGDKVLIQVARIFKNNIRDEDVAARWGGEELAVYLPKIDQNIAVKVAERIVQRVRDETNPSVKISCGVANWKADDKDIDYMLLVHKADQALYKAKKNGKNQLMIYED